MSQSLAQVYLHIVFSTKHQVTLIPNDQAKDLYQYLAGILGNLRCPAIIINGTSNHVHLLSKLHRTITISSLIEETKRSSSKWFKSQPGVPQRFYWQNGYGVFSIGQSGVSEVKRYIAHQEAHRKHQTFQDEYLDFLRKYDLEYNEKYLWD